MMKLKQFLMYKGLNNNDFAYLNDNNETFIDIVGVEGLMLMKYGTLNITELLIGDSDTETYNNIQSMCTRFNSIINKRKYQRMKNVMVMEYNPLWNVDGTTTTERTSNSENNETSENNTQKSGELENNRTTHEEFNRKTNDSDNRGIVNTSTNTNTHTNTEKNVSLNLDGAFNPQGDNNTVSDGNINLTNNLNSLVTNNAKVDGVQSGNVIDASEQSEESTDTYTHQSQSLKADNYTDNSDSFSSESSDTISESGSVSRTDETTENETVSRQGNIGVTSSQQLFKEEIEVAKINLYQIIAEDLKNAICTIEWGFE